MVYCPTRKVELELNAFNTLSLFNAFGIPDGRSADFPTWNRLPPPPPPSPPLQTLQHSTIHRNESIFSYKYINFALPVCVHCRYFYLRCSCTLTAGSEGLRLHCKLGHQNVIHEILKKHSIPFMNKFRFATSLSRRWFCSTFVFKLSTIYLGFNN